jgi:hypothetical protein
MPEKDAQQAVAEFMLRDAEDRLGYQQKFAAEGFKTLILINGGAIVGLLTYAGHDSGSGIAASLGTAFFVYAIGLVAAMFAFLASFFSQSSLRAAAIRSATHRMGLEPTADEKTEGQYRREGDRAIYIAIVLCLLSVAAFIAGSACAMNALTQQTQSVAKYQQSRAGR